MTQKNLHSRFQTCLKNLYLHLRGFRVSLTPWYSLWRAPHWQANATQPCTPSKAGSSDTGVEASMLTVVAHRARWPLAAFFCMRTSPVLMIEVWKLGFHCKIDWSHHRKYQELTHSPRGYELTTRLKWSVGMCSQELRPWAAGSSLESSWKARDPDRGTGDFCLPMCSEGPKREMLTQHSWRETQ